MASSQSVSIRIPQELLEQLDAIATQNYPVRKDGKPNRSRMILDLIQRGVEPHAPRYNMSDISHTLLGSESQTSSDNVQTMSDSGIEELIKRQVAQQVQIQVQIQQEVRQQLGQASEIAEIRQEVAEVKKP